MSAAVNVFARVTSPTASDRGPVLPAVDCPAVYDKDALRAARLADELVWALARVEAAAIRARDEDSNRSWAWLAVHMTHARQLEIAWLIACGELPCADGICA